MKSTVIFFKELSADSSYPLMLTSLMLAVFYAAGAGEGAELTFCVLITLFTVYRSQKSFKKTALSAFSLLSANFLFYSFSGIYFSFLISLLLTALAVFLFTTLKKEYAFICLFALSSALALGIGIGYESLFALTKSLASALKSRGALFGTVNNFYELAFSKSLRELIYNASLTGTVYDGEKLVSGVVNIKSGRAVSQLLAGKYFVNIALTLGVFSALFKKVRGRELYALSAVAFLAVIFGDVRLLGVFILIYNPLLYVAYEVAVFFSYLTASLLDLKIALDGNGSLYELIKYIDKPLYFVLSAAVLGVMTYFLFRLVLARFDIDRGRYMPKKVRLLVSSLGGEENLDRLEGESLTVNNPNLIDILKLDCDIRQNTVTLYEEDAKLLRDYYFSRNS